jgi:hypothetical protein
MISRTEGKGRRRFWCWTNLPLGRGNGPAQVQGGAAAQKGFGFRAKPTRKKGLRGKEKKEGKAQKERGTGPKGEWRPKKKRLFYLEKVYFSSSNFRESPFFLPQLQNRTNYLPQLFKPCILPPWSGFEGGALQ